jgi:dipeptidyl aminopeptidase/acylaminoacyl peptidase
MSMLIALLALCLPAAAQVDYARAEQFLQWNLENRIYARDIFPKWLDDGNRFWYRVRTPRGDEFYLVDPVVNTRRQVFDNERLAAAMSLAAKTAFDSHKLGFTTFEFKNDERAVTFTANKLKFQCDLSNATYTCTSAKEEPETIEYVTSPDKKWQAFAKDFNLYIRPNGGGEAIQLTTDGVELWSYGTNAESSRGPSALRSTAPRAGNMQWSPDSRKIAIPRYDTRNVKLMPLYSSTSIRPQYYLYPYGLPGDDNVPVYDIYIIGVSARSSVKIDAPSMSMIHAGGISSDPRSGGANAKWSNDSRQFYFINGSRGSRRLTLMVADTSTGAARQLISEETGDTGTLELSSRMDRPGWSVTEDGKDIVWYSTRDGREHYYHYDGAGLFKNQITSGAWSVGTLQYVDSKLHAIWFTAYGREPGRFVYHQYAYRSNLDGSGLTLLTPEEGDHAVSFAPSGKFFIDTWSRRDMAPVIQLRAASDGHIIRELERANIDELKKIGWHGPEVFKVLAADGVTEIYAEIIRPSDFDPAKRYPVIDEIYPVPSGEDHYWGFGLGTEHLPTANSLAELGFIVVHVQARGTLWRGKAFLDTYQGHMGQNTVPDHVAAIQQLGARLPYLDLARVGIYGLSGGGFASTAAILRFPDFYKVAFSMAGNHDNRTYASWWGEKFQGVYKKDPATGKDNYEDEANASLAKNLKGKLFILTGDLDDNVHPTNTLRLANELIAANKNFDMLVLPDRGHDLIHDPYVIRRLWDYMVVNLLGAEPPADYQIRKPETMTSSVSR